MLPLLSGGRMYPGPQPSVSLGVIQYENALPQTTQLIGPPEPSWVAMSGRPGTASDLEERRDREEGEVSSHFEQCANELPGSGRPGEFQEDRATVGFDGDSEPKKAQQWRSASTARAIVASVSSVGTNRSRSPSGRYSRASARCSKSDKSPARRARSASGVRVQAIGKSAMV